MTGNHQDERSATVLAHGELDVPTAVDDHTVHVRRVDIELHRVGKIHRLQLGDDAVMVDWTQSNVKCRRCIGGPGSELSPIELP